MELKLLDSIMHGVLKPWKLDTTNKRRFNELVKSAKAVSPKTNAELFSQLNELLVDYPPVQKMLDNESKDNIPLQQLLYQTTLPKYKDAVTHFYYLLIIEETLRFYNAVLLQAANWTELVDIRYQVGKTLTNVRVLAKQVTTELNELNLKTTPDAQSNIVHFTLFYLKKSLIQLYFCIQEHFKASLSQKTTIEDFYLQDLEEPIINIVYPVLVAKATTINHKQIDNKNYKDKLSFGWKNGKVTQLYGLFNELCNEIHFIDEERTSIENLVNLLIAKEIIPNETDIYLGCQTTEFVFIMDAISRHFQRLTPTNIEKSKCFWSKAVTNKNPTLITADNYFKTRKKSKIKNERQDNILATIQKYFT